MTLAAAVNSAPSASPTAGLPETVNGVVAGSLNAGDAENNSMTYVVQTKSAGSDVKVDGAGNFTYTPSVVQRLQAATTSDWIPTRLRCGSLTGRRSPMYR